MTDNNTHREAIPIPLIPIQTQGCMSLEQPQTCTQQSHDGLCGCDATIEVCHSHVQESLAQTPTYTDSEIRKTHQIETAKSENDEDQVRKLLSNGDAQGAIEILDRIIPENQSRKLLRLLAHSLNGDRALAHLELSHWVSECTCSLDAQLLLACLQSDDGDVSQSLKTLYHIENVLHMPLASLLTILIHLEQGNYYSYEYCNAQQKIQSKSWVSSSDPILQLIETVSDIASIHKTSIEDRDDPPEDLVKYFAIELLTCEHVIPTLVATLELEYDEKAATLLRAALIEAIDEAEDQVVFIESIVRLSRILGDPKTARRWLGRGLLDGKLLDPSGLVAELIKLPVSEWPGSSTSYDSLVSVVKHVAHQHPAWRDVQSSVTHIRSMQRAV